VLQQNVSRDVGRLVVELLDERAHDLAILFILGTGEHKVLAANESSSKNNPNRALADDSFYIEIPPGSLVPGTLYVNFEINPTHAIAESNYANNDMHVNLQLTPASNLKVKLFTVQYVVNGQGYVAPASHLQMMASFLRRAYPVPNVDAYLYVLFWPYEASPAQLGCQVLNALLGQLRILDGDPPLWRYYGMVTDTGGWMRGCAADICCHMASGPTGSASGGWDFDGCYGDWYGAHELGHTFCRSHTLGLVTCSPCNQCGGVCGCEQGVDPNYPYPNGIIGGPPATTTRYWGWDAEKRVVYPPTSYDLMSYCSNLWMSPYTYAGIKEAIGWESAPPYVAASEPSFPAAASAEDVARGAAYLSVAGTANLTRGTAELGAVYMLSNVAQPVQPVPSEDWALALLGPGGNSLANYPFTPKRDTQAAAGEDVGAMIFDTLPWVDGTARIVVRYRGADVASRSVSTHTPTVRVTYPNGGELLDGSSATLRWEGSDQDGDALSYALQYSPDNGVHWQALAVNLQSTQVDVPLDQLPGGDQALLRVLVSDGVWTGQDQSDATFRVARKAPQAFIVSPAAGAFFASDQQVMLVGEGHDAEDGAVPGERLQWSSDLQGGLGTGSQLSILGLQTGRHVITLRATDSNGQSGSATVTISVGLEPQQVYLPIIVRSQ
jgi:hypothetical protein